MSTLNKVYLTFLLLILSTSAYAQLADSPWPTFQHDSQHTGRSPFAGPPSGNLAWSYETAGWGGLSAPVIGPDGTIYVGATDSTLYAVGPDGNLRWKYKANDDAGTVSVGSDMTIYFCSEAGTLYALNADGSLKWSYDTGYKIYAMSPAIDATGVIYFGSDEKKVYALNPNGTVKWVLDVLGVFRESPAIGADGTIYMSTRNKNKLYAINSNGTLKWKYDIEDNVYITSPVISEDGTIYVGTGWWDNKVYAFDENGNLKWEYDIGFGFVDITGTPALGSDGTIYFGSEDDHLYALNPDGSLKWKFETGGNISASAVVDVEGTIYFGSTDGKLYVLNPDGSVKWTYMRTDYSNFRFIAINSDGTLYISSGKKLKAFFNVGTEIPDIAVSSSDISFNPENQVTRGSSVEITATIHEQSNLSSATFDVSFYYTDKTNLIGTVSRYILPGSTTSATMVWNTEGLTAGTYPIIVEISNATPAEMNTANNEVQTSYFLLPNLQDRIDAAIQGDTIWVEPGIYYEHITLRNGLVVKSIAGPDSTIIDGDGTGDVISAPYLDPTAVLDGFTIRNGSTGINIERGGVTIVNNIITGNSRGLWMIGSFVYSDPIIKYNLFVGNTGKAIDANNSWADVYNNTFVNNSPGVHSIGFYQPSPYMWNNIYWNNGDDLSGTAAATYSCIQNGDPGTGNISSDPLFVDADNGEYHLQVGSPCIDAGDTASPEDPDETRADIGAFYFDQRSTGINQDFYINIPTEFGLSQNYPNPFNPETTIHYQLPHQSEVQLEIYNILGQIIKTLVNEEQPAGHYTIYWNSIDESGNTVPSGVYLYILRAKDFFQSRKLMLIR